MRNTTLGCLAVALSVALLSCSSTGTTTVNDRGAVTPPTDTGGGVTTDQGPGVDHGGLPRTDKGGPGVDPGPIGSDPGPAAEDKKPPTARITYPTHGAKVTESPIVVRGTASDDSAIKEVRVNGIPAAPAVPDWGSWSAEVALGPGENVIVVRTEDEHGNVNNEAASVTVTFAPPDPCGDGECAADENCARCPSDCACEGGQVCRDSACVDFSGCGDAECAAGENCGNCAVDCTCPQGQVCVESACEPEAGCGDGVCAGQDEDCQSCEADCACDEGAECKDGGCVEIVTCGDNECSPDESCTDCPADCACGEAASCVNGACVPDPFCGDGDCTESCETCVEDCGECPPSCPAAQGVPDGGLAVAGDTCAAQGVKTCGGAAGPSVLVCDAATCLWTLDQLCDGGRLCDQRDATCQAPVAACIGRGPNEVVCVDSTRHVCGPDLVTSESQECESALLCELGSGPDCAACEPGTHRCEGAVLQACAEDGSGFEPKETCASAALCNAGAGQCTDAVCVPEQKRCAGDTLQICTGDQTGFEAHKTCDAGLCDEPNAQCDICAAATRTCVGEGTVTTCADDGQSEASAPCPPEAPFCSADVTCVGCLDDGDCPTPEDPCKVTTCTAGSCVITSRPKGEPCGLGMLCQMGKCKCRYDTMDCDGLPGCEINKETDDENCGHCGHSCLGAGCSAFGCQTMQLVTNPSLNVALDLDSDYLYFADNSAGVVLRVSKSGGFPTTLAQSGGTTRDLEVDYSAVYWLNLNEVYKVPKSGGQRTYIAEADGGRMALSGNNVYITGIFDGTIELASKFGGGSSPIVTGQRKTSNEYILGAYPADVVATASHVYWVVNGNHSDYPRAVRRAETYGENVATLKTISVSRAMTTDSSAVYWLEDTGIFKLRFGESEVETVLDGFGEGNYTASDIESDGEHVYYIIRSRGQVYRVGVGGGDKQQVNFNFFDEPHTIAVDDEAVYVIDGKGLHKIAKPWP